VFGILVNRYVSRGFRFPVKDSEFRHGWCGNRPKCVAVAVTEHGVAVRDTKDKAKNTLFFTTDEWSAFTDAVKHGDV
jgi:hypothetical protein